VSTADALLSPLLAHALENFASRLRARYGDAVVDVRLFGSVARGESHEASDVDVAVVLSHLDWETRRAVIDLATDIGLSCGLSISPTVFARQTWDRFRDEERPLVMDIVRDGIAL
jgi:predicted nucleotidyltransferase